MLFTLRKVIGLLLMPSIWGMAAVSIGLVLLLLGRMPRTKERVKPWGRRILTIGSLWLMLLAAGIPFNLIGQWLENRYPPVLDISSVPGVEGVAWVVVLGGGHRADASLPPSAYLREAALYRNVEGIRLHRLLPESRLLFTGFGGAARESSAEIGAEVAVSLGVNPGRIVTADSPRTTAEEARAVRELVGEGPVVLVTSATHMPRAVRLFEQEGIVVIPAPTGHIAGEDLVLREWLRSWSRRVWYADTVAHELFGLIIAQK